MENKRVKTEFTVDEQQRLDALFASGLLDSAPEAAFDEAVQLAAAICSVPIGLVSLVSDTRQFFKARVGLDCSETPREHAFCAHAIQQEGLFLVPDALADPRFRHNPLVTGYPHIRFYGGVPIHNPEGYAFGTLCINDTVPRTLTADQKSALIMLGRQVSSQIALRTHTRSLEQALLEKERLQKESNHSKALFQAFMDHSPLVSYLKDRHGRMLYYNQAFADRFEVSRDAWLGKTDFEIWPPAMASRFRAVDVAVLDAGSLHVVEETSPGVDNKPAYWRSYKFPFLDNTGEPLLAGLSLDLTQLKQTEQALQDANTQLMTANRRLHELAMTDGLTGLANRRAFDERLEESMALARRQSAPLSMILMDLDNFTQINNSYGHDEGDAVLRQVARLLKDSSRSSDLVCRYGGEEFAVLLPNTTLDQAAVLAERMRSTIADSRFRHRQVTLSAGASTNGVEAVDCGRRADSRHGLTLRLKAIRTPHRADSPQTPADDAELTLPRMADLALYRAKSLGKNQVALYDPSMLAISAQTA